MAKWTDEDEDALKNRLMEIDEAEPHDGTDTYIHISKRGYLAGVPYLFSSDARRAFIFRDEAQAREVMEQHPVVLEGATIGAFNPEKKKPLCARCDEYTDHTTADCPLAIVAG